MPIEEFLFIIAVPCQKGWDIFYLLILKTVGKFLPLRNEYEVLRTTPANVSKPAIMNQKRWLQGH